MIKINKNLSSFILSVIPAFILSVGFDFLTSLLRGMEQKENHSIYWFVISFVLFLFLFTQHNNGRNILAKFLKYAAYECWLSPLYIIIYTVISVLQANDSHGMAGAIGAGVGGILLIFLTGVGGGLLGLVLYLIGNAINKKEYEIVNETKDKGKLVNSVNKKNFIHYLGYLIVLIIIMIIIFNIGGNIT